MEQCALEEGGDRRERLVTLKRGGPRRIWPSPGGTKETLQKKHT